MNLEHDVERRDGVTFVTASVHNPAPVIRHARLENRLGGTVLPPRKNGVPKRGWDETGVTITVPAGKTIGIGYACSSPPEDPAVEIESTGRGPAPEDDTESRARRSLGTFRPPRMAVTEPETTGAGESVAESRNDPPEHSDDIDRAVRRIELGERLETTGVEGAADVLEELAETALVGDETAPVGHTGIEIARVLDRALEEDAEILEGYASRLRSRADRLRRAAEQALEDAARAQSRADRARSVELPVDTLERFA
ncbi:Uncharacterized protein AArcCO_0024 [Halalkaliarchaeum sp. AArc-CO]|uniref:DUF7857 domain-containing protein n=1 Tax=unclassified Halalkaliarchaeum TaxID=2678344 RepID=UPI00217E0A78|nr:MULTISPECIES: hypothetical protein [unclassified Halalkaliarchaeum]MDR5672738.1 hypothetical protein [Halalkaliarchaeum sp. AArc-GB]UWG49356.1 Uncharacterized protein AArcCO_0024 [Halalkaliarchaeum sp. AArc-CO]